MRQKNHPENNQENRRGKREVYKLTCGCKKNYIGQTGRQIKTRIKEHESDARHARIKKSAIAEHAEGCREKVDFTKAKVLAREAKWKGRMVRESIEIYKHQKSFNREDGFILPKAWKPALKKKRDVIKKRKFKKNEINME